jgi:uncharacterized protein (TIGR00730 family)
MDIAIFCGSSAGHDPAFAEIARKAGKTLAQSGIGLVYGGGKVGLMGVIADAALEAGGRVTGVITRSLLEGELGHKGLTRLEVVETMHERKQLMADLSDAFLALPGGAGTLDEMFEQWTWAQLGIHEKPCAFLNFRGYYDPIIAMSKTMVREGFMKQPYHDMLGFSEDIDSLIAGFRAYTPPPRKWTKTPEPIKA